MLNSNLNNPKHPHMLLRGQRVVIQCSTVRRPHGTLGAPHVLEMLSDTAEVCGMCVCMNVYGFGCDWTADVFIRAVLCDMGDNVMTG